jgi:hypothetical protein
MKNKQILTYLVTVFLAISFSMVSCKKNRLPTFSADQILLYAKKEGGIYLYRFLNQQYYQLTFGKDYYPQLDQNNKTIYFIRVASNEFNQQVVQDNKNTKQILTDTVNKKTSRWAEIYSYRIDVEKEIKIASVPLYDPGTDPKDLVRFVDNFQKLIVFSNYYPIRMFDTKSGKMISDDPSQYFSECNIESNDQTFFVHIRQLPRKDYIASFDELENPEYTDAIFEASANGSLIKIRESQKDQINKQYFYGFTYYPMDSSFIYSYNHELFIREKNGKEKLLFPGIHPFCYVQKNVQNDFLKFPWFQCSFLVQDENKILIGEQNRLSLIDKRQKKLIVLTKEMLQLSNNTSDPYYLFDHLDWLGFSKNRSSILLISSKKIDEKTGPDRIVDLSKNPDLILLLSWDNEKLVKLFEMNEKKDFSFDLKDIDKDGKNEIINRYSASNFICEERFQAAGRSLLWIDVYHQKKDGTYEIANQSYPEIYKDLLGKLKPFYQRALTATRMKEAILCKDDLDKLANLVREAEIIVKTQK